MCGVFKRNFWLSDYIPFDFDLVSFLAAFSFLAAALTLRLGTLGAGGASNVTGASIVVMFVCLNEVD